MKIATFVNNNLEVTNFYDDGVICLFDNNSGCWNCCQQIPLAINRNMGLAELKSAFRNIGAPLVNCEVFLIDASKGVFHVFLEELGFRTWKSSGTLFEQLDHVAQKDAESVATAKDQEAAVHQGATCGVAGCGRSPRRALISQSKGMTAADRTLPTPLSVGDTSDGYYRIDLAEVLDRDPDLNSKQILIPFFQKIAFKKLEVLCDHRPKWFSKEFGSLKVCIASEVAADSGHGITVTICPNK
ncbi:MAG: Fe-only nitrogenase accessory protein AnfO [Desulfobulbus sp.]